MSRLPFVVRMRTLIIAWRNVVTHLGEFGLDEDRCNELHQVMRQTLPTMLMGEWATTSSPIRANIRSLIEKCLPLVHDSETFVNRCQFILLHLDAPWEHPVLQRLMGLCEAKATDDSVTLAADIEYLATERACMIELRLVALCEAKLYSMVSALAGNFLRVLNTCHPSCHPLSSSILPEQYEFVHDLHLLVLYRLRRFDLMLIHLRAMELLAASEYCNRPTPHRIPPNLHKYHESVMDTALQVFLTRFLPTTATNRLPLADNAAIRQLCCMWVRRNAARPTFAGDWQRLVDLGTGHRYFYRLLDVLTTTTMADTSGDRHTYAQLTLLCRGITYELNELEYSKTNVRCDERTLLEAERRLAPRFDQMAALLGDDMRALTRELMLTAFSLDPQQWRFNRIQRTADELRREAEMFLAYGDLLTECPQHVAVYAASDADGVPSKVPQTNVEECPACGKRCVVVRAKDDDPEEYWPHVGALHWVTAQRSVIGVDDNVEVAPNSILDAIEHWTGPESLREDLLMLISAPRIKFLSWRLKWSELRQKCLELLDGRSKLRRVGHSVAAANSRLQFLRPDYARYQHMQPHEYAGIEPGYEQFYVPSGEEDSDGGSTNATENGHCESVTTWDADMSTDSASETERAMLRKKVIKRRTTINAAARRRRSKCTAKELSRKLIKSESSVNVSTSHMVTRSASRRLLALEPAYNTTVATTPDVKQAHGVENATPDTTTISKPDFVQPQVVDVKLEAGAKLITTLPSPVVANKAKDEPLTWRVKPRINFGTPTDSVADNTATRPTPRSVSRRTSVASREDQTEPSSAASTSMSASLKMCTVKMIDYTYVPEGAMAVIYLPLPAPYTGGSGQLNPPDPAVTIKDEPKETPPQLNPPETINSSAVTVSDAPSAIDESMEATPQLNPPETDDSFAISDTAVTVTDAPSATDQPMKATPPLNPLETVNICAISEPAVTVTDVPSATDQPMDALPQLNRTKTVNSSAISEPTVAVTDAPSVKDHPMDVLPQLNPPETVNSCAISEPAVTVADAPPATDEPIKAPPQLIPPEMFNSCATSEPAARLTNPAAVTVTDATSATDQPTESPPQLSPDEMAISCTISDTAVTVTDAPSVTDHPMEATPPLNSPETVNSCAISEPAVTVNAQPMESPPPLNSPETVNSCAISEPAVTVNDQPMESPPQLNPPETVNSCAISEPVVTVNDQPMDAPPQLNGTKTVNSCAISEPAVTVNDAPSATDQPIESPSKLNPPETVNTHSTISEPAVTFTDAPTVKDQPMKAKLPLNPLETVNSCTISEPAVTVNDEPMESPSKLNPPVTINSCTISEPTVAVTDALSATDQPMESPPKLNPPETFNTYSTISERAVTVTDAPSVKDPPMEALPQLNPPESVKSCTISESAVTVNDQPMDALPQLNPPETVNSCAISEPTLAVTDAPSATDQPMESPPKLNPPETVNTHSTISEPVVTVTDVPSSKDAPIEIPPQELSASPRISPAELRAEYRHQNQSLEPSMILLLSFSSDKRNDRVPCDIQTDESEVGLFAYHPEAVAALRVEPLLLRYDRVARTWRTVERQQRLEATAPRDAASTVAKVFD